MPVNALPIEEATPQVETEISSPIVEAEATEIEPQQSRALSSKDDETEIIENEEEIAKVDTTDIKPEKS